MSNGNRAKSALEKSIDVLKRFLEDVKNKCPDAHFIGQADHALKYQDKFVELMKNFEFKKSIYDDLVDLRIRDNISVNLHDSLFDFIEFYKEVVSTGSFTNDELRPVWKALAYQSKLTKRMKKNTILNIHTESVCGRRPRIPVRLPDEPV